MIKQIAHIGFTVHDLDKTIEFYKTVLQLHFVGEMRMAGEATDKLFQRRNAACRVAYFTCDPTAHTSLIELIEFADIKVPRIPTSLFNNSISELCFTVENIDEFYRRLLQYGVEVLSAPQYFDATEYDMGKSKAIYFRDPNGIILEATETLE